MPPQFGGGLAASVAVTNLVGFDVDLTGSTAIARLGGDDISTFAAGTLTQSATVVDSFCNRVEGVAALQTHVSFIRCDAADGTDVLGITIASSTLGSPEFSNICDEGDFCFADLEDGTLSGNDDTRIGLGVMQAFPFDYSKCSLSGSNHCDAAWAYTDTQGNAGVVTYRWFNNKVDQSDHAQANIDPTASSSTSFCATRDDDGKNYLYAANQNANPKGFEVDFTSGGTAQLLPPEPLFVSMTQVWPGTSSTAGSIGIGCGEGKFTVGKPSQITVWARGATSPLYSHATTALQTGGLTMSDDAQWVAYADDTGIHVFCAVAAGCFNSLTNETAVLGTVVFSTSYPDDGTFKAIKMDGAGSNLWVATDSIIARYSIFESTTGSDVSYDPDLQPSGDPEEEPVTGIGGISVDQIASETGLASGFIGALLWGFGSTFLAGALAGPTFMATRSVGLTAGVGIMAVIISTTLAYWQGFVDEWFIVLIFMAIVAMLVLGVMFSRRS